MSTINNKLSVLRWRFWRHWPILWVLWLVSKLPFSVAMALGKGLGLLAHGLMKSRRRIGLVNLALCFPKLSEAERVALMRENFICFGRGLISTTIAWWGSASRLKKLTLSVKGLEHIDPNKGTMFINPHLYTVEIGGRMIADNIPFAAVYQRQSSEFFDLLIKQRRLQHFTQVIERSRLKSFMKALTQGENIAYLPDQDFGRKNSVFAPFFNVPTATATATARIAEKTQAQVVFIHATIDMQRKGFELTVTPALKDYPSGDPVADAARINHEIEKIIEPNIANYMWLHKRFKTRPDGMPSVY